MPSRAAYQRNPVHYSDYQKRWAAGRRELIRQRARDRHRETRKRVIAKYGGSCQCPGCFISIYEFLAIDHVDGGGCRERREKNFPNSQAFYSYLDKNPVSEKYQVLCHNCNSAKGFYGSCPHGRETCPSAHSL